MTHYVRGMFLYYPCRKPAIRDDLLERTRSASSKVTQAISVANLLQELSEAKTKKATYRNRLITKNSGVGPVGFEPTANGL